jgi:hypothetical protein
MPSLYSRSSIAQETLKKLGDLKSCCWRGSVRNAVGMLRVGVKWEKKLRLPFHAAFLSVTICQKSQTLADPQ